MQYGSLTNIYAKENKIVSLVPVSPCSCRYKPYYPQPQRELLSKWRYMKYSVTILRITNRVNSAELFLSLSRIFLLKIY